MCDSEYAHQQPDFAATSCHTAALVTVDKEAQTGEAQSSAASKKAKTSKAIFGGAMEREKRISR